MIKLQTPVNDDKNRVGLSLSDKIMMVGSCFSDNIGKQLKNFGFDVCINPFGTLYNPVSVLQGIRRLAEASPFTEKECEDMGAGSGMICSFSHHTSFAAETKDEFLRKANTSLEESALKFRQSNRIVITLGTSWCFRHIGNEEIVSNCLKRPACEFVREKLSVGQIIEALEDIMRICKGGNDICPKQVIFTVSPIRHLKDGAHGNQISKASLLLAIDDIVRRYPEADYFPAYEIVMDELRDYRFYAEDMCHPSSQTVDYIRERFLDWAMPEKERPQLEENIRNYRRSCHIPMNLG